MRMLLSDLDLTLVDQDWNVARRNQSVTGKPLSIGGVSFADGVGTHANSQILVHLNQKVCRFRAQVGVDDGADEKAMVRFVVQGDGRELWNSGVRKRGEAPVQVDLDVSSIDWLVLNVSNASTGTGQDHANWCQATFEGISQPPVIVPHLPEESAHFLTGRHWLDTQGKHIQAHGGGILRHDNRWWWYGEDRSNGYIAIGTSAYVSDDLHNWEHMGVVLPRNAYDAIHGEKTLCERPKVIYNPTTQKFVLWFHYDRSGYDDSRAGVAIADTPQGPFHYLGAHRPIESSTFRDMNLFVDDDNRAYVFYAGEENSTMHVVRLNDQWTGPEQPLVQGRTWERILINKMREAPAPFKHEGKYYLITSGCTGWNPNPAELAVADNPLGPYQTIGDPCVGPNSKTTFGSQSTCVIPDPNRPPGHFIYLGDRWKRESLHDSRYIWLPFHIQNGQTTLQWHPHWTFEQTTSY